MTQEFKTLESVYTYWIDQIKKIFSTEIAFILDHLILKLEASKQ